MGQAGFGQSRTAVAVQAAVRTVVVASADVDMRRRVSDELRAMRWNVRETSGGAEAIGLLDVDGAEALVLDHWLPDLEVGELAALMRSLYPEMEILRVDGGFDEIDCRSTRRGELLTALRRSQSELGAMPEDVSRHVLREVDSIEYGKRDVVPALAFADGMVAKTASVDAPAVASVVASALAVVPKKVEVASGPSRLKAISVAPRIRAAVAPLPEMIGDSALMRELAWLIRLVAPRTTPVLIEGATGTGKELVAKAVHRLSARASKPFVVLNCAAIPESLLEAELFGHTRGAFTGAVQSRTGRVEAANGGTLFLDEIGEMPIALQAKMLRFLECGEIQRVGGNETMRVDVRIVAATHQPLKQRAGENAFRLDLYHRLAVFPVRVPSLAERMEDVPALARFFLERLGEEMPVKRLSPAAERLLMSYDWPGNVRELAHVLERATILAEDRLEISEDEVRL